MLRHRRFAEIVTRVAVVWAIILILGAVVDRHQFSGTVFEVLLMVFGGFVIGWVLATIACKRRTATPPD